MAKKQKDAEGNWFKSPLFSDGSTARGMSPETLNTTGTVAGPKAGKDTPDPMGHTKHGKK